MSRWFAGLPIHRKLVAIALTVTSVAMVLGLVGLLTVDLIRYRATAADDTRVLAGVMASNATAAVNFDSAPEATDTLSSLSARESITRACIYLADGELFASYQRSPAHTCPAAMPAGEDRFTVAATEDILGNDAVLATVYVERELSDAWTSILVAIGAGFLLLLVTASVAVPLAHRLNRSISQPIVQLATAARATAAVPSRSSLPEIKAGDDEVGELVRAFSDMLTRVTDARESLRRKEIEREELLARERKANRLKDEFLAAVSHELRTPLNAMMGWVQILSQSAVNEQVMARGIASISRNAKAQTRVIEDLVDVSRIVSGKLSIRYEALDLREAVDEAVDEIRPTAEARQIDMTAVVPDTPCLVSGDRDRIRQVVANLLSNAAKFTSAGGSITLVVRSLGSQHEIEVTDTGIGIPSEFLPYVFDRFRQADGSSTREHGGLGLGLAIVKEISGLHGGTVHVTSEGRGRGATFTVRLPAQAELLAANQAGLRSPNAGTGALAGVRVLAVDDNPDALELMTTALESAGATVRAVSTGAEAVDEWARDRPDVLLCDLAMPGVDGFEVLQRVRTLEAGTGFATPAVAISAHATEEHRAVSRRAGFLRHVTKPYEVDELIQITRWAANQAASGGDGAHGSALPSSGTGDQPHV